MLEKKIYTSIYILEVLYFHLRVCALRVYHRVKLYVGVPCDGWHIHADLFEGSWQCLQVYIPEVISIPSNLIFHGQMGVLIRPAWTVKLSSLVQ